MSTARVSTARAFARRTTVQRCCSSRASTAPESWKEPAASVLATALREQIADGPHPPEGSPMNGRNWKP
eukprot:360343-Karenia_brevis.AAC.1